MDDWPLHVCCSMSSGPHSSREQAAGNIQTYASTGRGCSYIGQRVDWVWLSVAVEAGSVTNCCTCVLSRVRNRGLLALLKNGCSASSVCAFACCCSNHQPTAWQVPAQHIGWWLPYVGAAWLSHAQRAVAPAVNSHMGLPRGLGCSSCILTRLRLVEWPVSVVYCSCYLKCSGVCSCC